jgi:hypothetical protein
MTDETGKPAGGSAKSDKAPELDELARRLLDLWQDQLTAVAANPDLAAQAARLMAAMPLPGMWLSQLGQMGGGQTGWQSGEDLTKAWSKMTQDWMAQDWRKGEPGAGTTRASPKEQSATRKAGEASAGAAPAAAAPQPGGGDLGELSRRLAGIEQRLEQLAEQSSTKPASARSGRRTGGADGGAAG